MRTWIDRFCVAFATGGFIGYGPARLSRRFPGLGRFTGAGLAGTALGLALLGALPEDGLRSGAGIAAAIAFAAAVSHRAEACLGVHDDPRIVIDELVGFWAAAWGLPRSAWALGAAFVLFRLFDVLKPPPCRWLERLPGGLGVVLDDVGAGLLANSVLRLAAMQQPGLWA